VFSSQVDERHNVRHYSALLSSRFTDISHKLGTLHLGLWFKVTVNDKFSLVHLYTCRLKIDLSTSCAQHCFCSWLHLELVRKRRECSSFRIKNPLSCIKFHCFHNGQTHAPFFFLFTVKNFHVLRTLYLRCGPFHPSPLLKLSTML